MYASVCLVYFIQACAYKVGALKLWELRHKAEKELGEFGRPYLGVATPFKTCLHQAQHHETNFQVRHLSTRSVSLMSLTVFHSPLKVNVQCEPYSGCFVPIGWI